MVGTSNRWEIYDYSNRLNNSSAVVPPSYLYGSLVDQIEDPKEPSIAGGARHQTEQVSRAGNSAKNMSRIKRTAQKGKL